MVSMLHSDDMQDLIQRARRAIEKGHEVSEQFKEARQGFEKRRAEFHTALTGTESRQTPEMFEIRLKRPASRSHGKLDMP